MLSGLHSPMSWLHAQWPWLHAALTGAASPWVIALALVLVTLLLEDVAIAAGVALATQGSIDWALSFAAVAGGIALGDLGLYALGLGARRVAWLRRRYVEREAQPDSRAARLRALLDRELGSAVLLARVIPGLRLATYTACGFVRVAFIPFTAWVALAVAAWTAGLYLLGIGAGELIARWLGVPPALAVAIPVLLFALAVPLWRRLRRAPPPASCPTPHPSTVREVS